MFTKLLTHLGHLEGGGIRNHNPSKDGVLPHFQEVLSLNIGDPDLNLGRSSDSISLKVGRAAVPLKNWSCIVF